MPIYEKLMGNPFVDVGVCAICEWLGRSVQPEQITAEDLYEVVRLIAPIYCEDEYRKQIRFIFPNSPVTQHSKIQKGTMGLIEELKSGKSGWLKRLDKITALGDAGDCMGCGRRSVDFHLKKTEIPLSGSGKLRNFFPLFTEGAGYCAACALAIQFAPLAFVRSGGKFLTLHSNSWNALRYWTKTCVTDIIDQGSRNDFSGFFNPKYSRSQSALFYMVRRMIEYEERRSTEKIAMQVYSFSNDNRGAELDIYHLSATVFNFLRNAYQSQYTKSWNLIVRSGFRRLTKKGFQEIDWKKGNSDEVYQKSINLVYNNLLQDKSILRFFIDKSMRKVQSDWKLLSLYFKEVRNMK
ncbi:MAG: type I-B CRISPR-associated protein Cas8b1/Cst1 [Candidatus Poribacteria bacterium]|nr:type I-B CRISPR-associated protein Cas8b1/Cst1 [Candidatus Poribacteria bacterium]